MADNRGKTFKNRAKAKAAGRKGGRASSGSTRNMNMNRSTEINRDELGRFESR